MYIYNFFFFKYGELTPKFVQVFLNHLTLGCLKWTRAERSSSHFCVILGEKLICGRTGHRQRTEGEEEEKRQGIRFHGGEELTMGIPETLDDTQWQLDTSFTGWRKIRLFILSGRERNVPLGGDASTMIDLLPPLLERGAFHCPIRRVGPFLCVAFEKDLVSATRKKTVSRY